MGNRLENQGIKDINTNTSAEEGNLRFPEFVEMGAKSVKVKKSTSDKICIFGVGESSIAGDIISAYADDYSEYPIPSFCSSDVPGWVDSKTEVILVSYSGNNTLINSVYNEVKRRGSNITCIVQRGYLKREAMDNGDRVCLIPEYLKPRSALGYELGVLASLVEDMGFCKIKTKLLESIQEIKKYRDSIEVDIRIDGLKSKMGNNTIAIYGSPDLRASLKRWKMEINQDLKYPSFYGELPEFNHNEIVGWANHLQDNQDLKIIFLRGKYKDDVLSEIIDKSVQVLEENGRHIMDVIIPGSNPIIKNMYAIVLGDYVIQKLKKNN